MYAQVYKSSKTTQFLILLRLAEAGGSSQHYSLKNAYVYDRLVR